MNAQREHQIKEQKLKTHARNKVLVMCGAEDERIYKRKTRARARVQMLVIIVAHRIA